MPPDVLAEVLDRVGALLSHVSYTVSGLAALVVYGFTSRLPTHVSITCSVYARDAIKCWAAAQGMIVLPTAPDAFGVPLPDGTVRKVRLQVVDGGTSLDWVAMGPARTRIASMPALLNALACKYVELEAPVRTLSVLGRDITWLLRRIIEDGTPEQRITAERAPNVAGGNFWSLFTFTHPGVDELFYEAGFRPPCGLTAHFDEEDFDSWLSDETLHESLRTTNESSNVTTSEPLGLTARHVSVHSAPPLRRKRSLYFRQWLDDQPVSIELAFIDSPSTAGCDSLTPFENGELDQLAQKGILLYPIHREDW